MLWEGKVHALGCLSGGPYAGGFKHAFGRQNSGSIPSACSEVREQDAMKSDKLTMASLHPTQAHSFAHNNILAGNSCKIWYKIEVFAATPFPLFSLDCADSWSSSVIWLLEAMRAVTLPRLHGQQTSQLNDEDFPFYRRLLMHCCDSCPPTAAY
ncbi:hypothetical protein MSAN_00318600 [Mycena sanguinolenta]|uniref:Uncharacterized protein n=1 Tax=Mycena sanguinolenta TaxID=230812 RepID=A0A8H6Z8N6_9AGAR|nr:hypothetical protein MSAN_00318600 [Mycena sanguinolenta]